MPMLLQCMRAKSRPALLQLAVADLLRTEFLIRPGIPIAAKVPKAVEFSMANAAQRALHHCHYIRLRMFAVCSVMAHYP